jgi:hypothetical protein
MYATSPSTGSQVAAAARSEGPGVSVRDLAFVLRAAGERTTEASAELILRQIAGLGGGAALTVIQERPFSEAVRRTLELGMESGKAWTIGIDADVLLTCDGVQKLVKMCRDAKPESFTVTGLMLCKFYGGFVFRGVHCYRSELLGEAAGLVGERTEGGPDPELKPESAVVHAMAARGRGYEGHPVVLAAHDFEQSYKHIYVKMRLRGRREVEGAKDGGDAAGLLSLCREGAEGGDADYRVAQWGVEDGIADAQGPGPARASRYDWFAPNRALERRLKAEGILEKEPFSAARGMGFAERVIAGHRLDTDTRTPGWVRQALSERAAA